MLKVKNLCIGCNEKHIVKNVSFELKKGEILGVVGESGSGKSTMLKSIVSLSDNDVFVEQGDIIFEGTNINTLSNSELRKLRGERICMVFQKPDTAMDPLIKIKKQFYECVRYHSENKISKEECYEKSKELLETLRFDAPKRVLDSYPFELSGGMNQRVALAMALINKPPLILADEPTSALDVSVQSQVVRTMMDLRKEFGTSILIVTHNMKVVSQMVDRIGVMYKGELVEIGARDEIINNPQHEYTKSLIASVPVLEGRQ